MPDLTLTFVPHRTLELSDRDFLEQLKVKKSIAKILSTSNDVLSTENNGN